MRRRMKPSSMDEGFRQAQLTGSGGDKCSSAVMDIAMGAISGIAGVFTGGRATVAAQLAQQVQLMWANQCSSEQNDKLTDQLTEQQRMNAGIGRNAVGNAGSISNGVQDTLRLSNEGEVNKVYQNGASGEMSSDASLSYQQDLRANTDAARRNALETAARNAKAQAEYSRMADEALALSQSAQGPTSAQQAQTQMDRAREGAASARVNTQIAFEHARLMTEEEQRAGERLGQQRRDRLYRRLSPENAPSVQSFQMFQ